MCGVCVVYVWCMCKGIFVEGEDKALYKEQSIRGHSVAG